MNKISKVAVIGSGTMGSSIAASVANSGVNVLLYDLVSKEGDRSAIARKALDNMVNNALKPLMDKTSVKYITPLNLEDHLSELKDVDWVIEAIIEQLDLKRNLYKSITPYLRKTAIISSNTSTIPLRDLVVGLDDNFKNQFVITHFFNPPRYLELLEFVALDNTNPEVIEIIKNFCDVMLGKEIVVCKDTPGFIANRIGCFWLEAGLRKAINENVPIDVADMAISEYTWVPKTGIFGLWDLIGIDLMPLITKSMVCNLPKDDAYTVMSATEIPVIQKLISEKRLGRKTKAGFYKIEKSESGSTTFITDLKSGEYIKSTEGIKIEKITNLKFLSKMPSNYGRFAWKLTAEMLNYAASLVPSAAYNIKDIDTAMKAGYGWKYGPFELIDMLSDDKQNGAEWLRIQLEIAGIKPADLFREIGNQKFYNNQGFYTNGSYNYISKKEGYLLFDDINNKPSIIESASAKLVDIEDNVLCLLLKNKMGVLDEDTFNMIIDSIDYLNKNPYEGILIAGDHNNFCAGADVNKFIQLYENNEFAKIEDLIKLGQKAMNTIKKSSKPVVCAVAGVALGGGCELLLHSHGVQVHANSKIGLVETRIGLIPGWGGCKEMVMKPFRSVNIARPSQEIVSNFNLIRKAINSDSAIEAINMGYLDSYNTQITFNKNRLFFDAKQYVRKLSKVVPGNYINSVMIDVELIKSRIGAMIGVNELLPHENKISEVLLSIFTAAGKSSIKEEELNAMELEGFMYLIKSSATYDRMVSLIKNKKLLYN